MSIPSLFVLFCSLLLFAAVSDSILAGDPVDWVRNGFLVKVLARDGPNNEVRSCSGSMLTASLVLTSARCVMTEAGGPSRKGPKWRSFREFVVLAAPMRYAAGRGWEEFRSTAKLVYASSSSDNPIDGWALLRTVPRNTSELCPASPAPKWLSRLNFRPTLEGTGNRIGVDERELADKTKTHCYVLGFSSPEKGSDFLDERSVFHLFLSSVEKPSTMKEDKLHHFASKVHGNFTPCYEDVGAPLLCKLHALGDFDLQLGIFQTLKMGQGKEQSDGEGIGKCQEATEMRFTLFANDNELMEAIERFGLPEFMDAYQKCGFVDKNEQF